MKDMKILKSSVVYGLFLFISLYSVSAFSQNISAIKEAQTVDGSTLTSLEVGQQFQYRLVWNCSFTNTPPPEGCGDFLLEDILPEGLDFVSCTTTSDYTCTNNAGVVEIDKVGGASGVNLGAGESSEAFIVVELSSDLNDYAAGVFPDDILNNATVTGSPDQDPVDATATTPVNAPENNWEVSKEDLIPALPINPALDNPVVYRIEVCPNGPAGIGTGTIPITNTILTDTCEAGALFVGAELNGSPFSPTAPAACPNLEFNLGDLDPVDGCAILDVTLEYPTGAFAEGDIVQNMATAVSDEGDVGVCELPCTNVVEQEISAPNPDGNISKSTRRSELAVGALSQYTIRFNLNDSNVLLNNVVVQDIFPTNITVTNFNFGGWDDDTVIANITELGTGIPIATAYDGSTTLNVPLDPAATGLRNLNLFSP